MEQVSDDELTAILNKPKNKKSPTAAAVPKTPLKKQKTKSSPTKLESSFLDPYPPEEPVKIFKEEPEPPEEIPQEIPVTKPKKPSKKKPDIPAPLQGDHTAEEFLNFPEELLEPPAAPQKKLSKKDSKKMLKQAVELLPAVALVPRAYEKNPEIEFVLRTYTKYDVNWYYLREKFVALKRWIFSPWRRYSDWWNRKFNSAQVKEKELLSTLNQNVRLQALEDKIHADAKKITSERLAREVTHDR